MVERLTALGISRDKAEQMAAYGALVKEANEQFNLTRILSEEEMAQGHFYDSLTPFLKGLIKAGDKVVDIGTGAGFPGVPLALYEPALSLTLIDATEKKVEFVREACRKLGIENVRAVWGRSEELSLLPEYFEAYDVALARAVARLNILLELSAGFVKKGGLFVAYKGADAREEAAEAERAAKVLGFSFEGFISSEMEGKEHGLLVYKKVASAPKGYPRRFAKIRKEPL